MEEKENIPIDDCFPEDAKKFLCAQEEDIPNKPSCWVQIQGEGQGDKKGGKGHPKTEEFPLLGDATKPIEKLGDEELR